MKNVEVSIAMASYNGASFIREQLDSIYAQSYSNLQVIVCDDGSIDGTADILEEYKKEYGLIYKINGSTLKVVKNFEKVILLCNSPFIALSDQDDVWLPTKIEKSLKKILELEAKYGQSTPLLVFSDLTIVDSHLNTVHKSLWNHLQIQPKNTTFNRLLVENVVTGCTILMNRSLAMLAFPAPSHIIMHDVWIALVASCFGQIDYIAESTILYRQHSTNTVGVKLPSLWEQIHRSITKTIRSDTVFFGRELKQAEAFEKQYYQLLTHYAPQKEILRNFINIKKTNFFHRKFIIIKYRFFGNTLIRTLNILIRF